ncbi:MAG: hypothetical protein AAF391_05080 [Bacteroidota bacterium]
MKKYKLTKYGEALKSDNKAKKILIKGNVDYNLETLTDAQAEELLKPNASSPYIELASK